MRWWHWPNHGRGRGKLRACGFELLNEELSSEQCIIKWIRVVNNVFYFTDCIMFRLLCLAARWPDSDCFFFNWYHFPGWISLSIIDLILTRLCSKFKQLVCLAEFVFVLGACRESGVFCWNLLHSWQGAGKWFLRICLHGCCSASNNIQAKQLWPVFPHHILDGKMRFIIYIILISLYLACP